MPPGDRQKTWVQQVLGVSFGRAAPASGPLVGLQRARVAWDIARKQARTEVEKLETAILARVKGYPFEQEVAASTHHLFAMFATLDERLIDRLDQALNAPDPAVRAQLQKTAASVAGEYLAFVNGDKLLQAIDNNPFHPIAAHKTLSATLTTLRQFLG